ncbi:hypothetical protein C8R42DRAFT_724890 [Lentinula raphanica]|nr:hypothetical protein C8R42DRAFT_724890 [Lentinula raphanica]
MAATATQPISLGGHGRNPYNNNPQDINMASGSYTSGDGGSFNPASYTRHFLGSPMSYRSVSGSYNGRLLGYPGSVGSITMGSPMDVHRDPAVSNALRLFELQDELCRNYTCCGLHLTDLHALLEHFEDIHVVCVDQPGGGAQARISVPFEPQVLDAGGVPRPMPANQLPNPQQQSMHQGGGPVDPDDMELEMPPPPPSTVSAASSMPSSPTSTPSPPETLLATPLSTYSSPGSNSLAAAYPGGYPGVHGQKSVPSSSPPSPRQNSLRTAPNPSSQNTTSDGHSSHRPNLALNLPGFASSSSRPTVHSPFITGPPPPGGAGAWPHSHGTPGGVDMTYMGNSGMGMGGFGGNFHYQNTYGYNFPLASDTEHMSSENGTVDMGCVQPAMLFSNPSSPHSGDGADDEDADAEFDIDFEEKELPQAVHDVHVQKEVKKEKAASKTFTSKTQNTKAKGQYSAPPSDSNTAAGSTNTTPSSVPAETKPAPRIGRPPTAGGGSGLLQSKPFKCPKPNCNKSYKQANGLKYHITHGSCNFAPPKDMEHVQAILDRKRKQQQLQEDPASTNASTSATSSGANTPRSGMATPVTPSSINSSLNHALTVNTGVAAASGGSNSSSTLSSPVGGTPVGAHFGGNSNFTPTPSSLSTALSSALSLSSPTTATPGYHEGAYQDGETTSLSRSNSYGQTASQNRVTNTSTSSSSLINALTPVSTNSNVPASTQNNTSDSLTNLRSTLSSLPPSELLAIEAEAERQLKPYACGVGDCPRRYKNMNGLRYHYQHSGDHGAIGLQWLASGKHECLAQRGDKNVGKNKALNIGTGSVGSIVSTPYPSTGRVGGAEREGRKVRGAGSSSKPTSRASSVNASRTSTPVNTTFPPLPLPYVSGATGEVPVTAPQAYQPTSQYTQSSSSQPLPTPAHQYQQVQQFASQATNVNHPNYQSHLGYPAPGV